MTKVILATKEIVVNIHGIEYDCLLIPRNELVDIDFKQCPEDHPVVKKIIDKIKKGEL